MLWLDQAWWLWRQALGLHSVHHHTTTWRHHRPGPHARRGTAFVHSFGLNWMSGAAHACWCSKLGEFIDKVYGLFNIKSRESVFHERLARAVFPWWSAGLLLGTYELEPGFSQIESRNIRGRQNRHRVHERFLGSLDVLTARAHEIFYSWTGASIATLRQPWAHWCRHTSRAEHGSRRLE